MNLSISFPRHLIDYDFCGRANCKSWINLNRLNSKYRLICTPPDTHVYVCTTCSVVRSQTHNFRLPFTLTYRIYYMIIVWETKPTKLKEKSKRKKKRSQSVGRFSCVWISHTFSSSYFPIHELKRQPQQQQHHHVNRNCKYVFYWPNWCSHSILFLVASISFLFISQIFEFQNDFWEVDTERKKKTMRICSQRHMARSDIDCSEDSKLKIKKRRLKRRWNEKQL